MSSTRRFKGSGTYGASLSLCRACAKAQYRPAVQPRPSGASVAATPVSGSMAAAATSDHILGLLLADSDSVTAS